MDITEKEREIEIAAVMIRQATEQITKALNSISPESEYSIDIIEGKFGRFVREISHALSAKEVWKSKEAIQLVREVIEMYMLAPNRPNKRIP